MGQGLDFLQESSTDHITTMSLGKPESVQVTEALCCLPSAPRERLRLQGLGRLSAKPTDNSFTSVPTSKEVVQKTSKQPLEHEPSLVQAAAPRSSQQRLRDLHGIAALHLPKAKSNKREEEAGS